MERICRHCLLLEPERKVRQCQRPDGMLGLPASWEVSQRCRLSFLGQLVSRQRLGPVTVYQLSNQHVHIPHSLADGFVVDAPKVPSTSTPPNHPSIELNYSTLSSIIETVLTKGCYLRCFSREVLESALGPLRTSPTVDNSQPGKSNQFHLILVVPTRLRREADLPPSISGFTDTNLRVPGAHSK